ncbi:MAG: SDR family oxidoreductase [Saprospiraceae bacterium]|nr:SDR family oxidoreductase [Saprospiraceae bacterium]
MTLKNKIVLVTGGAGGIGAAISKKMADEGASVIVTYNSNAEKAANLVKTLHCSVSTQQHSVFHAPTTDAEKVKALAGFVTEKYGRLDILVNNAGITTPVPHDDLEGLSDEWIDKIMQTNVRGTFAMIRAFKGLLLAATQNPKPETQNASLVVNISSVAAVTGIGSNVAYCASKAAVDSMTRSLARALAPKIRVVSVSPGWVLGEYAKTIDPAYLKMQEDLTPLSRLATPEDVANTVYALATYLTFTTGAIIPVDGGRPLK